MKTNSSPHGRGVERFLAQHGADVTGVQGYDRLHLRGSLRHLYRPSCMFRYLCSAGVRLKDFAGFVSGLTNRACAASAAFAARHGRPMRYLESCLERKEDLTRRLAERDRIDRGLIGVFSILEPCLTYSVRHDATAHRLYLHLGQGRCLHHYFYFKHAEFGLMRLRVDDLTGTATSANASAARVRQGAWVYCPSSRWHRSFPSPLCITYDVSRDADG